MSHWETGFEAYSLAWLWASLCPYCVPAISYYHAFPITVDSILSNHKPKSFFYLDISFRYFSQ